MSSKIIKKRVLLDSCFWFGLFDNGDEHYNKSQDIYLLIKDYVLVIPFPTLYETINTKLQRNLKGIIQFEKILRQENIEFLQDDDYKMSAFDNTIDPSNYQKRKISFVDMVIREMVKDINLNIDYLITYNPKDFEDLCQIRRIELISTI